MSSYSWYLRAGEERDVAFLIPRKMYTPVEFYRAVKQAFEWCDGRR